MTGPRIAVYDIETAPNLVYTWGLFKQMVSPKQIVRDWSLLSICWKWLGEKQVHYIDCEADPLDDSTLLAKAWELFDEADILVGQNSKHFDTRKMNARFIEMGFPPYSPIREIDTKVEASNLAMFTSNKLEWLAPHLTDVEKDQHNEFPGFELWTECLNGNPRAWAAMRKYNPQDVIATEKLYLKLRPWIKGHPNVGNYDDGPEPRCNACGSTNLQHRGHRYTQVGKYPRLQCNDCGKWNHGRFSEHTKEKRASLLSN
jgi:RNase H-like protein